MSAITYVGFDSNASNLTVGDTLLEPLRFCGRQWKVIAEPLQEGDILWKVAQVAWKIVLTIAMVFLTKLSLIPGLVGAILKSYNTHSDTIECEVDHFTDNSLREFGIQDSSARDSTIARHVRHNLNLADNRQTLFSTLNVSRQAHIFRDGSHLPVFRVNITTQPSTFRFVDHIVDCFKEPAPVNEDEKKKALMELSDMVLGIERPLDPLQAQQAQPQNYSSIFLMYSTDFRKMRVEAFS